MRTEMPRVGLWSIHLTLIVLVGGWLALVEYILDVNFIITVAVTAALILSAAVAVNVRVGKLKCHRDQLVRISLERLAKKHGELKRVVTMHSTLRCIFRTLHPEYRNEPFNDYLFGQWLWRAVTKGNILDWLRAYDETGGTRLPRLVVLLDHIPEEQRVSAERTLIQEVLIARGEESFLIATEELAVSTATADESQPPIKEKMSV